MQQNLHVKINEKKTKIIYVLQSNAHFLGMTLRMIFAQNISYLQSKRIERFKRLHLITKRKVETAKINYIKKLRNIVLKKINNELQNNKKIVNSHWTDTNILFTKFLSPGKKMIKGQRSLLREIIKVIGKIKIDYDSHDLILPEKIKKNFLDAPIAYQVKKYKILLKYVRTLQEKKSILTTSSARLEKNKIKLFKKPIALPLTISADLKKVKNKLINAKIISLRMKLISKTLLINCRDINIVFYYRRLALKLLTYYRCADNLKTVKNWVKYFLKNSLILTLSQKHKMSSSSAAKKRYGIPITVISANGKVVSFLSNIEIENLKKEFLINPVSFWKK